MSEFCGLWKFENNQHALVPPKTECGLPKWRSGIKNGHIRYPLLMFYGGTQKERKKDGMWLAQVAEGSKTVTHVNATPPMEERRKKKKNNNTNLRITKPDTFVTLLSERVT